MQRSLLVVLFACASFEFVNGDSNAKKATLSAPRLRAEGDAAFRSRDYSKALRYFRELIVVEPNNHVNFHKRAMTYLFKSEYYKAIADWNKALTINDEFGQAYFYRGKTHLKLGKCAKALTDFNKALVLDESKKIEDLVSNAEKCVSRNEELSPFLETMQCPHAEPLLEEILEIAPYDVKLNFAMSRCLFEAKKYQSVLKFTGNILRVNDQNLEALFLRGEAYKHMGEHQMALKHWKSGLRSDPENKALKSAHKSLKRLLRVIDGANEEMNARKYEDAIEGFTMALEIDPSYIGIRESILLNRCKAAVQSRQVEKSSMEEYCEEAATGDSAEASYWRGEMFGKLQMWEEAEREYMAAQSKDQRNGEYQEKVRKARFEVKKAKRKDYYQILGIDANASERDVKKAFRKCGLAHHPDKTKHLANAEEREKHEVMFKDCVEAQEILSDPQLRSKYDRGEDVLEEMQGGNRGGTPFHGFPFSFFQQGSARGGGSGGTGGGSGRTFTFRFG